MKKINVVDIFCGCGGLSYGFHKNGFNIVESYDFFEDAIKTYRKNFPNTNSLNIDISRVNFSSLKGKVDLLIGGPPCQPFSIVGKRQGVNDSRDMIPEYIRILQELRPKMFILENVSGLVSKKHEVYFNTKLTEMRLLGYNLNYEVLDFRHWGIVQKRKRLIIIGSLSKTISMPEKELSSSDFLMLKDIFDIDNMNFSKKTGSKIVYAKNPVVINSRKGSLLVNGKGRPLDFDDQSNTITASAGNAIHFWDKNKHFEKYFNHIKNKGVKYVGECKDLGVRRLTFDELKTIQTFPEDFHFIGKESSIVKQLGNSVPPKFSIALAKHIKQHL